MNFKKFLLTFIVLLLFIILVKAFIFSFFYDLNYIKDEDKKLISLNENQKVLFMKNHMALNVKKFEIYYIENNHINIKEYRIGNEGSEYDKFYCSNYQNHLDKYIWLFELLISIIIIFIVKYLKKNNK